MVQLLGIHSLYTSDRASVWSRSKRTKKLKTYLFTKHLSQSAREGDGGMGGGGDWERGGERERERERER